MQSCYDDDFYQWILAQAALLKKRRFDLLDIERLAEEIESLAHAEARHVYGHVKQLLIHLALQQTQEEPIEQGSHDEGVGQVRRRLNLVLDDSPSLRRRLPQMIEEAWAEARVELTQRSGARSPHTTSLAQQCPFNMSDMCGE
jgi:hypothetical protein